MHVHCPHCDGANNDREVHSYDITVYCHKMNILLQNQPLIRDINASTCPYGTTQGVREFRSRRGKSHSYVETCSVAKWGVLSNAVHSKLPATYLSVCHMCIFFRLCVVMCSLNLKPVRNDRRHTVHRCCRSC